MLAPVSRLVRAHPFISFIALLSAWSGPMFVLLNGPLREWANSSEAAMILSGALEMSGPTLAGLVILAFTEGAGGFRRIGRELIRWRFHPALWLAVILGPFLVKLTAMGLAQVLGSPLPLERAGDVIMAMSPEAPFGLRVLFILAYGWIFVGPLNEELGLRGVMISTLLPRFGKLGSAALLAPIWALFHVPLFLGTGLMSDTQLVSFLGLVAIATPVFSWVYLRSGRSLLAVGLLHFSYDTLTVFTGSPSAHFPVFESTAIWVLATVLVLAADWKWWTARAEAPVTLDEPQGDLRVAS